MLFTFPSQYWFAIGLSGVFSLTGWAPLIRPGFLVSWVTQVSTGLLSVFAYRAVTVFGYDFHRIPLTYFLPYRGSFYPTRAVTRVVWAVPRSLATTCGIMVIFFSCGYLDVSVPRVGLPLSGMAIAGRVAPFGYLRVYGYLRLTVTFRSLSRPSSPPRA